jgi:hypothetical protein
MFRLKELARRGTALAAAIGLFTSVTGAMLMPAIASADALNPLTERSLRLTSSAPGYVDTDASGNAGTDYALPGSGPNGKKTGEIFSFRVSSDSTSRALKAFTLQWCTTPAGDCTDPGDGNDATHSNLNVNYSDPQEAVDGDALDPDPGGTHPPVTTLEAPGYVDPHGAANFAVFVNGALSPDWDLVPTNYEIASGVADHSGSNNNFVTLTKTAGETPAAGQQIYIVFYGTDDNYITNPGSGYFFVRINTYDTDDNTGTDLDPYSTGNTHLIDGGVTVANVMNDSIQLETKVLETMAFSVGTVNPDMNRVAGAGTHGPCDSITGTHTIKLGASANEFSLSPQTAFDGISYWRLSSNSSAGATVYYSGYTLSNTVGDQIEPTTTTDNDSPSTDGDGTAQLSHPGEEQFGLGFTTEDTGGALDHSNTTGGVGGTPDTTIDPAPDNTLAPLSTGASGDSTYEYGQAGGNINPTPSIAAKFAFKSSARVIAEPIATENTDVVDCSTGKMRYIANIAPNTPAGIYTSKINYIAAPQY